MITEQELESAYPVFQTWTQQLLEEADIYARPVASTQFARLREYFAGDFLQRVRFVPCKRVPTPPLSRMGFPQFLDFEHGDWDGITFLDTFFVRWDRVSDESLFFHELIHVLQWNLLGQKKFVFLYARGLETDGYRCSPLERMAYDAQDRFTSEKVPWDVRRYVQDSLRALGMY